MPMNWLFSEIDSMVVVPSALWAKPCPHCEAKALHFNEEASRVFCHACGFEVKARP